MVMVNSTVALPPLASACARLCGDQKFAAGISRLPSHDSASHD